MRKTSSTLIAVVLLLLSLGIVMLASTSSVKGTASFDDPYYFLKRQLIWLFLAVLVGAVVVCFDYHWWQKLSVPLALVSVVLLALVFVPGIGLKAGGSNRWLCLGPLTLQPSEFAKFSIVIVLASWMVAIGPRSGKFKEGLLFPIMGLGVILGLLINEPDFGATLLVGVVGMAIMFAGGTRLGYLAITAMLGGCGFILAIMRDPVRTTRFLAFIVPEKYPDAAHQLAQSKIAFIMGGWSGVGLGNSIQKQFYLPEAYNDFILAIIGEELGCPATCLVVMLFLALLICGMIISFNAPDRFGRLLGFGITMMVSLQASINIGVVTGCLPTKGLPLPFISYGGSSLLMSVAGVCVLLNIAHHYAIKHVDDHTRLIKDKAHRL